VKPRERYRRWPRPIPSLSACWRSAPTVLFICLEIFASGVRAFECLRSSACNALVQATRFVFLAIVLSPLTTSRVLSTLGRAAQVVYRMKQWMNENSKASYKGEGSIASQKREVKPYKGNPPQPPQNSFGKSGSKA
jgi:hypothetical protein